MNEYFARTRSLPFDTASVLNIRELISLSKQISEKNKLQNDLIHLKTLFRPENKLKAPFSVCDYFSVPYDIKRDGENIWEIVYDIQMQVFTDLGKLIDDGNDYICDFDDDGCFSIFLRPRK